MPLPVPTPYGAYPAAAAAAAAALCAKQPPKSLARSPRLAECFQKRLVDEPTAVETGEKTTRGGGDGECCEARSAGGGIGGR